MVDLTNNGAAYLVNELDQILDEIYQLAGELGTGITADGRYKNKVVNETSEIHRKRAKMAMAQIKVRDLVEAISESEEARAQEPLNLSVTMGRLVNIYNLMDQLDESRQYFDSLRTLIKLPGSFWQVAFCVNLIVIGYLDEGRTDDALAIYYEMIELRHHENMIHGLVRSAFNIISRLVMSEEIGLAHKVYNSMASYCFSKANLALVTKDPDPVDEDCAEIVSANIVSSNIVAVPDKVLEGVPDKVLEGQASIQQPAIPFTQPILTLIQPQGDGTKSQPSSQNRSLPDLDYEEAGLIRAQAAINIIAAYAINRQANKALEIYKTITETDDIDDFVTVKSMAAVNLIRAFINAQRWNEAFHYYREMKLLGQQSDNALFLAKAAVELIGFADKKHLPEAEYIYNSLNGLSTDSEFILEYSRACGNLIFIYGDFNELDKARALFDSMDRFGNELNIIIVKAKSAVNLMSDYCSAQMHDEAEKLFDKLLNYGNDPELEPSKVHGLLNLLAGYLKSNLQSKAEALYMTSTRYEDTPAITYLRSKATFNMVAYFIHKNDLENCLRYYKYFNDLGETEEVFQERGKALINLVSFVGSLGLVTSARNHYMEYYEKAMNFVRKELDEEATEELEDFELMEEFDTPIGGFSTLISQYVQFEEEDAFTGFDICEPDENISSILGKSAFNLIIDYVESDKFKEAEDIYNTLLSLNLSNSTVASDVAQAALLIISAAAAMRRWKFALRVFSTLNQLPDTQNVNKQKCTAGNYILNYNSMRSPSITKAVYDSLITLKPKALFGPQIARACLAMIICSVDEKQYETAFKIYTSMADLGKNVKVLERRAEAALYLMRVYETMGWLAEAKKLYQGLSNTGKTRKAIKFCLKAARSLARLMRNSGLVEAAAQLQAETDGFKRFKNVPLNDNPPNGEKKKKSLN
jgi:pentatricopeptide repeat protein